jgi:hypothetical protein
MISAAALAAARARLYRQPQHAVSAPAPACAAAKVAKVANVEPASAEVLQLSQVSQLSQLSQPSQLSQTHTAPGGHDEKCPPSQGDATRRDASIEKRAPIGYDSRGWAEAIARLDVDRPPADVPPARWRLFIDDCRRFFDEGWATQAVSCGWQPVDLFGCNRNRPFARIDQAGLLWLTAGAKVVAISETCASIQTATGARQTYTKSDRVLVWELRY